MIPYLHRIGIIPYSYVVGFRYPIDDLAVGTSDFGVVRHLHSRCYSLTEQE